MADESSRSLPPASAQDVPYQVSSGDFQMFPCMYPILVPSPMQSQEHMNRGPGIYAVPVVPNMGPIVGLPFNNLIPLTYNIPTGPSPSETGPAVEEQRQTGPQEPQAAPQRQVVRRFQIAFQIDLLLILKLAVLIFLFNQDGSRQRLVVLVFFASLIYLHQTGALTPLVRWLSQCMHRAAAPPQPPRPAAVRHGNDNADIAEVPAGAENENGPANEGNQVMENGNMAAERGDANVQNQRWGILKEIQMIVLGFITSLLPGFHNHVD